MANALICALIGIVIGFVWLYIKNVRKAYKNPDVIIASKLGMSMPIYYDCKEVYKEWYAWRWNESLQQEMLKPNYSYKRFPKNPNAFHKYESYMNYIYAIKEWEAFDDLTKRMHAFNNPYKKREYKWIEEQNIPIFKELAI